MVKLFLAIQNDEDKVIADKEVNLIRIYKKGKFLGYELPDNFSVNEFIQENTERSYPQMSACTLADNSI